MSYTVSPFIICGIFGFAYFLATINSAAINTHALFFVQTCVSFMCIFRKGSAT